METLYVAQEKCSVKCEGEHLKLVRSGETLAIVPLVGVKTIVLLDSVSITAPALDLLMYTGVDVIYQSKWGKVKGRVLSMKGGGAVTIDEVMGVEGVSAKYYWDCFKNLLKNPVFTRREYRPSPDYVNSLLNLGYAFLSNEVTTCLIAKHFDLEIGFLHSIHYGRNSLSLDIMEEFRAPFVDAWVLTLLNKKQLKSEHFHVTGGDWRLTEDGFRKFCGLYHERVPLWRVTFREQVNKLKTALTGGGKYEPYRE